MLLTTAATQAALSAAGYTTTVSTTDYDQLWCFQPDDAPKAKLDDGPATVVDFTWYSTGVPCTSACSYAFPIGGPGPQHAVCGCL